MPNEKGIAQVHYLDRGKSLVRAKIRLFYERVGFELHSLMDYKKRRGLCLGAIGCMEDAERGGRCAYHWQYAKDVRQGKREPLFRKYQSAYGQMCKQELDQAREDRKRDKERREKQAPAAPPPRMRRAAHG